MNAPLDRWTEQHALLMCLGIGAVWLESAPELLAAMAAASFLGLIKRGLGSYTPGGGFGWANGITLARTLGGLVLLAFTGLGPWIQAGLLWLLIAGDGLDGWAARRYGTVSAFGLLFDHECDALLLLAACVLLFVGGKLGAWILLPGALRYGFVLYRRWARPPQREARGNRFTRWVGVTASLGFAVCLLPVLDPTLRWALAVCLSSALAASFLHSLVRLYRPESPA
jgi:phosphatidylglycerophosphate synthase